MENLYLILDNDLSKLSINNFCIDINHKNEINYNLEENCTKIFIDFILVASRQNWSKKLAFDEENLYKLASIKLGNKKANFNLSIKNMLMKSYYEKNSQYFVHAWKMFLKVLVSDLKIDLKDINIFVNDFLNSNQKNNL